MTQVTQRWAIRAAPHSSAESRGCEARPGGGRLSRDAATACGMREDEVPLRRAHVRELLGVRRSSVLLLLFVGFYFVYLVAGGVVFAALEAPAEAQLKTSLLRDRRVFLDQHACVTGNQIASCISFCTLEPFSWAVRGRDPNRQARILICFRQDTHALSETYLVALTAD